jgi:hypothetical protein
MPGAPLIPVFGMSGNRFRSPLVLYRLPRVNDLRFADVALAVADEHIALIYSTTYPLS